MKKQFQVTYSRRGIKPIVSVFDFLDNAEKLRDFLLKNNPKANVVISETERQSIIFYNK